MSKNVYDSIGEINYDIQRHSFDWTHHNSFTAKLGKIYPLFTSLVPANFKFDCDANLGLQFMPMRFPVQTPIKARMSFFKVPLRTLWKDYQDYVSNFRDDIEEPFHDVKDTDFDKFYGACQLGDFLDIPNVIYRGSAANPIYNIYPNQSPTNISPFGCVNADGTYSLSGCLPGSKVVYQADSNSVTNPDSFELQCGFSFQRSSNQPAFVGGKKYTLDLSGMPSVMTFTPYVRISGSQTFDCKILLSSFENNANVVKQVLDYSLDGSAVFKGQHKMDGAGTVGYQSIEWNSNFEFIPNEDLPSITNIYVIFSYKNQGNSEYSLTELINNISRTIYKFEGAYRSYLQPFLENTIGEYEYITCGENGTSPYYSSDSNPDGLRLACYRARAYESVYNAYFRDVRNNPFYVDGKVVYNKWLPNYDGGADNYPYTLHSANWEKDFLTTAVVSPQQGKSPLVGLTTYLDATPDSTGGNLQMSMALVDDDGKRYKVKFDTGSNDGGATFNVAIAEVLPDDTSVQSLSYTNLMNAAQSGISIPDLRVVNAYQKFLELNMRKGYSYKDIIEGRFDCKVRFDELMMPEFIGGFTRDIQMNRVVQSVDANYLMGEGAPSTYEGSLGSLSGDAFLSTNGQTPHIHCFCDEESIIIGVLSVVPVPAYSQLLPKDYLYRDLLDHFNPEFNNLGFQPIKYAEVCPLQLREFGLDPSATFGYQRPWYEYVAKTDTVHGLMRTNLRNFIMNRNFVNPPVLGQSFLLVDEEQVNDVFAITEDTDKIIGQCHFNIKVESPVSRVAIPRLD